MSPSVLEYSDPVLYLRDAFKAKQSKNPRFSLRSWARHLGLTEPTPLSQILKGNRPIPLHYLPKLSHSLGLSLHENQYLEAIVQIHTSRSSSQKEVWVKRAKTIRECASYGTEWIENFRPFSSPLIFILMEMSKLPGFKAEAKWIKARLLFPASLAKIAEALNFLLLTELFPGPSSEKKSRKRRLASQPDVPSDDVKKFHESALKQASREIYRQGVSEREFESFVFAAKSEDIPAMKKALREFSHAFMARFECQSQSADKVFHLNLNLFSQTTDEPDQETDHVQH